MPVKVAHSSSLSSAQLVSVTEVLTFHCLRLPTLTKRRNNKNLQL